MPPPKNEVWKYFTKDRQQKTAKCTICKKAVKIGNITDMHNHLNISHGIKLYIVLDELCEKWKINKQRIVIIVTDNGANIVAAINISFGAKHLSCFAHIINLIAQKLVEAISALQT